MFLFVNTLHVILCILLILVILIQPGKGGDVSSAFGAGASTSVFGPRGAAAPLSRITTGIAVLFMVTSITLAVHSNRGSGDVDELEQQIDEFEDLKEGEGFVPAPTDAAGAPEAPAPALELPMGELPADGSGAAAPEAAAPAGAETTGAQPAGADAAATPAPADAPADPPAKTP